ncbi:hypothetical protein CCP4SC76_4690003 [Gammaproteobacteria bacterium]
MAQNYFAHVLTLDELADPERRKLLKWAFTDPERLRPGQTTQQITETAARRLGELAVKLRGRGHDPQVVAHFLNRLLFCLFSEDVGLLPEKLVTKLFESSVKTPDRVNSRLGSLFQAMAKGGDFGSEVIDWFNGGLFDDASVLTLEADEIKALAELARLDWSAIEPSIFGTLFERGLDPDKRSQLGAHFTDPQSIMRIINPVIVEPLRAEWETAKAIIEADKSKKRQKANAAYQGFLERLRNFRVLDPACGSGNFLYLALRTLKDIEHQATLEAEALGLLRQFPDVGPDVVHGIEINPYAAELARVTVWIGDIQWMLNHGFSLLKNPILRPLETIEQRDALINPDGTEAVWPEADVIIGNPPFLGDKKMRGELGDGYVEVLRTLYDGRVPGGVDLVTYWFEKARSYIEAGSCQRAGLVATNSIRQKRNRPVLERILETTRIFNAWDDEEWINEGAAVRVSLVCFGNGGKPQLDGLPVVSIHADLAAIREESGNDLTQAKSLANNQSASFFGLCLAGPFKVDSPTALSWLKATGNPNGQPNSRVVRPIYNGSDITRRWSGHWVVDFSAMTLEEAADYLAPFAHVESQVKPIRMSNREAVRVEKWWRHGRYRPDLRAALKGLSHYIATPETAKHRFFVKLPVGVAPEHKLIVIPRQDAMMLGILLSRLHCIWAVAKGGRLGVGNDPVYNSWLST